MYEGVKVAPSSEEKNVADKEDSVWEGMRF